MRPVKVIRLTQGQCTIVDPEDYKRVMEYHPTWHARYAKSNQKFYAYCSRRRDGNRDRRVIGLHNLVSGYDYVDHINGDPLDNRRNNLRESNNRLNQVNRRKSSWAGCTSRFKGVRWNRERNCWTVIIWPNGIQTYVGSYHDEIEAAHAYDTAALNYYGEYARLNFPRERAA